MRGSSSAGATTSKIGTIGAFYKYGSSWFHWTGADSGVTAVKYPLENDPHNRVIFTGLSGLNTVQVTDMTRATSGANNQYPTNSLDLGLPVPSAPTVLGVAGTLDEGALNDTRFYVCTFVNTFGEEGPPSNPTNPVAAGDGQTVNLQLPSDPGGRFALASVRVYRLSTGTSGADYLYVGSVAIGTTTMADAVYNDMLGEVLQTTLFDAPPTNLKGLVTLAGGVLAGFVGDTVYMSEPGFPYAWPANYKHTLPHEVVGLATISGGLVALTKGNPYMFQGLTPASMMPVKIDLPQSCVSANGIVNLGPVMVYPSPDGLVAISQGNARVLTEKVFTREQWEALNPSTMVCAHWENTLVVFYTQNSVGKCFMFNPLKPDDGIVDLDMGATAVLNDLETDRLYFVDRSSNKIHTFNTGDLLTFTWRSRPVDLPTLTNFGAARLYCDDYVAENTFRLLVDSSVFHEQEVRDDLAFRLPSGYRGRRFEIEVEGTETIREIHLGKTVSEVKSGQ